MNKNGPVIIIEDDEDDQLMLEEIFKSLGYNNEVVFFKDGNFALEYLNKTEVIPFLILSDINMPRINGMELRNKVFVNEELHLKCIPYLFFTTSSNKKSVIEAYAMAVQGFFVKPSNYKVMEDTIRKIMEYWKICVAPNEYAKQ
jgi:CheY-like chemotaxis protein